MNPAFPPPSSCGEPMHFTAPKCASRSSLVYSILLRTLVMAAAAAVVIPFSETTAQAQKGTISGTVVGDDGTPVSQVSVTVVGTNLTARTNSRGQFTLSGVSSGTMEVRALRVGFVEQRKTVTVAGAQTVELSFQMKDVPVTLNPVVTTATGDQRRVEVGNSIAQIDAADVVKTRAIANMADLLTARAPGVTVFGPTQLGAGTRIRIRGTSSLSLSNNPLYIVDGIRVEGTTGSSSVSVGGTTPSRINDLNPDEIESIEVVRGPSAATLYGTAAANGVIVITTKRGVAGRTRFTYFTEQGGHVDRNTYPTAYRAWRTGTTAATNSTAANTAQCFLTQRAASACVQDSVTSYNLYEDPESTPNGIGYRQLHGLQMSGGSEALRFFIHSEWENDNGVLKVPDFDKRYLTARGRTLREEEATPNHIDRVTTRANFNLAISPKSDVALSVGYTQQDLRLPTSDDSGVAGVAGNTYGGPGFKYNTNTAGDTLYGWRQVTPRDVYQTVTGQGIKRLITSISNEYRPFSWLSARANVGLDYINRLDTQLCRFGSCPDLGGDSRLGLKIDNRTNFFTYSASTSASASQRISDAVQAKTTVGVQFSRAIFDRNGASAIQLAPGATTVTSGAIRNADEASDESRTLGAFVEEYVALNDRLFVTGAIRSDRNSAFGANFKTVFYPKLAISWVASDETFFTRPSWMDQVRLRSAYGASGVQPGTTDAVPFYSATTARGESADLPALVFSTLGNRNLKPERSTELELGIDGTFFNNRLSAEITHYKKLSRDALISRGLPPSLGTGSTSRFENLGEVSNTGWETLISAQLIQREAFGWNVLVNGAANVNRIESLGGLPAFGGTTQRQREGFPLNGWWARTLTGYSDTNADGIITLPEITVSDTVAYIGSPLPLREWSITNGVDLFRNRVRLSAMIDYKGGHKIYNNTERIRCASRNNCEGLISPTASLFKQARTVMVREHVSRSVAGFIEDGDFIRFRELSLSMTSPEGWAGRILGSRTVSATLSARNLGMFWTKYTGVDPEAFATTGDAPSEFQAFAPTTYYALRFSFGF